MLATQYGDVSWERMIRAVEKVRDRLRRATAALNKAGVPYAVAGGNAVAAWVSRVDECAVRNTQDGRTEGDPLTNESSTRPVERLFPFVSRSRILIIGRGTLRRSKGWLNFVLITVDISENSRAEILKDFGHYPVVQHYTPEELEKFF